MNSEFGDVPGEEKPVVLTPVDTPSRGGLRLQHLMFGVGACAILFWFAVVAGLWVLAPSLLLLFAMAVGLIVIVLRRSVKQKESLLWALAVAAERSLPLADAALAFADQFGASYRWRVQLLASLLNEGVPLPEALSRVPGALSREAEVLVRTGYTTGTLARSLREAASHRTSQDATWGATAARLFYLGAVLVVMQSVTMFIMYFIIPKFEAIFKDFGVSLPAVTVFTIQMSHYVIQYFYLIGPLFFVIEVVIPVVVLAGLLNSFALWWDIPVIDSLGRRRHSTLILRSLALAIEGRKSIPAAVTGLAEDYPSGWVRRRLRSVDEDVRQGRDWVESLSQRGLIRPAEAAVLDSSRRVGNLEWALREMAESADRRLGYRLRFWLQLLSPLLIIALGGVVFLFAVAYFSPLLRLIEALSG